MGANVKATQGHKPGRQTQARRTWGAFRARPGTAPLAAVPCSLCLAVPRCAVWWCLGLAAHDEGFRHLRPVAPGWFGMAQRRMGQLYWRLGRCCARSCSQPRRRESVLARVLVTCRPGCARSWVAVTDLPTSGCRRGSLVWVSFPLAGRSSGACCPDARVVRCRRHTSFSVGGASAIGYSSPPRVGCAAACELCGWRR